MESSTPDSISEVDVFAAETIENWYPTYDLLRSECPVYHVPDTETYFLTRYQDIHQILRSSLDLKSKLCYLFNTTSFSKSFI